MTQIEEELLRMLNRTGIGMKRYPVREVVFLTTWNGYDVYDFRLDVDEDEVVQLGMPRFFLIKGDEITETTYDQAKGIIEKVFGEEEESDDWDEDDDTAPRPESSSCMMSCADPASE